jgi:FkbM family methyltransferase
MATCTGRKFPSAWQTRLSRLRFDLRQRLASQLSVTAEDFSLQFVCNSPMEEMRVHSLLVKEEGTIAWLKQYLRPGEVFLDVGANIGLYSLVAAHYVGPQGHVYAVEPHSVNVISLLQNVAANHFQDRIHVIPSALHDSSGVFTFNYFSLEPGSAMSQLGETRDGYENEFVPVMKEMKVAVSIDDLVARHGMAAPHHIKIDVDGNELQVVDGMMQFLRGSSRPRSVQVEVNARYKDALFGRLEEAGYEHTQTHYTAAGKSALAKGADPNSIPFNVVLEPRERA